VTLIEDALMVARLPLRANRRCTAREHIADLVGAWGHGGTNRRRTLFDACLLFDAPMTILFVGCILELARIW
jgi:hypothetical protein